jgi:integrase
MLMDDGKRCQSEVQWLNDEAGRLFAKLHFQYLNETRCLVRDDHPYYFVNERSGTNFGQPLKLSNAIKLFERAVRRVGLSPSDDGVNPHGGRHFYGYYCASILRLPAETTQKLMHHVSLLSTMGYYHRTAEAARDDLRRAKMAIEADLPTMLKMDHVLIG